MPVSVKTVQGKINGRDINGTGSLEKGEGTVKGGKRSVL